MRTKIISRESAIQTLQLAEKNAESTMVAVYGRRRIGKTFLVDEYFKDESKYFYIKNVGIKNEATENQVKIFYSDVNDKVELFNKELEAILISKGIEEKYKPVNKEALSEETWEGFFSFLAKTIDNIQSTITTNNLDREIVYFFDEIPYAAEQTKNLANRLGAIWEKDFKNKSKHLFIMCGSAASWMIQEIENAKGGLYSRCRHKIKLGPFKYREAIKYLKSKHECNFNNEKDAVKTYMSIGGVAKYLDFYAERAGLMFNQSITNLMFSEFKDMRVEFDLLLESIFKNAKNHKEVIEYLSSREKGASEKDIVDFMHTKGLMKTEVEHCLKELIDCDYLMKMNLIRSLGEETVYRLIDEYCRFYFKWIHGQGEENFHSRSNYWNNEAHNTKIWFGTSFEVFCFRNRDVIIDLLDLTRFSTKFYSYNLNHKGGAEGDVVVEASIGKKIQGVFIIENKFKEGTKFSINDNELKTLQNKIVTLKKVKKYDIDPQIIFITSDGCIENEHLKKISSGSFTIADF